MTNFLQLRYLVTNVMLLFWLIVSPVTASAASTTLAKAELEQILDAAFHDGVELARAASCMKAPASIELAFKAYRDSNKALHLKDGPALNAAFGRGMKKLPSIELDFESCMIEAMIEGRKTMLRGTTAAAALLDKSMLPETMESLGDTLGGVMIYARGSIVNKLAACVEEAPFRKRLSVEYIEIMKQYLADHGDWVPPYYMDPFERSSEPFETKVGGSSRHSSCARQLFEVGMAVELFRQINEAEGDTRGKWLLKRLSGR